MVVEVEAAVGGEWERGRGDEGDDGIRVDTAPKKNQAVKGIRNLPSRLYDMV